MREAENELKGAPSVVVYSRRGCHLCDEARELLRRHEIVPTVVDIDSDPDLRQQFDASVPVVEINGRIRFRGSVDPVLLRRILDSSK